MKKQNLSKQSEQEKKHKASQAKSGSRSPIPTNSFELLNVFNHLQHSYGNRNMQTLIQPKLKIGSPNDKYEKEADRVAGQIMQKSRKIKSSKNSLAQIYKMHKITSAETTGVSPQMGSTIYSLKGRGQPLPKPVQDFFEPHFGNINHVRIHTNKTAEKIADGIGARAFTFGHEIGLARGQHALDESKNRHLLAHELTHIMQQRSISRDSINLIQRQTDDKSRQLRSSMAIEYAEQNRVLLGEETAMLNPVTKALILGCNFDVGFASGLLEGLKGTVNINLLHVFAGGFEDIENIYDFYNGLPAGILVGITNSITDNLVGIYEIAKLIDTGIEKIPIDYKIAYFFNPLLAMSYIEGKELYKYLTNPEYRENVEWLGSTILKNFKEFVNYIREDPNALLKEGESLGLLLGEHAGEYFENMVLLEEKYYDKAIAVGNLIGYLAFEIALMIIAPEAIIAKGAINCVRFVAKAAKGTKFAARIYEIIEKCPGLSKLIKLIKDMNRGVHLSRTPFLKPPKKDKPLRDLGHQIPKRRQEAIKPFEPIQTKPSETTEDVFRELGKEFGTDTPGAAVPMKKRTKYRDFETVPSDRHEWLEVAKQQIKRLETQLGIPIPKDRVLEAPWVGVGKKGTSEGLLRYADRFWSAFKKNFPNDFKLLGPGKTIKPELAKKYGWKSDLVGDKLVHHHLENGPFVVAIPDSLHRAKYGKIHRKPTVEAEP